MIEKLIHYTQSQYPFLRTEYEQQGFTVISFSNFLNSEMVTTLTNGANRYVVDISSLGEVDKLNTGIMHNIEQLLSFFPRDTVFISDITNENYRYALRYCFAEFEDYYTEFSDSKVEKDTVSKLPVAKKITDLTEKSLETILSKYDNSIFGHDKFKSDFKDIVKTYRVFHSIGEHKILSIFILGESGVGKTHIAQALFESMGGKKRLAKINFGNYSSQDALNSLIGSPRGYIGSDGGELFDRVQKTDIGIILIDEFEKATTPVFNYFLDVLETGKASNSMGEEIDISGFIIFFTSNIPDSEFESKFSPELRSRFDYISKFMLLSSDEKRAYVINRGQSIVNKYKAIKKNRQLDEDSVMRVLKNIEVDIYHNMRQLNGKIKREFVKYISDHRN